MAPERVAVQGSRTRDIAMICIGASTLMVSVATAYIYYAPIMIESRTFDYGLLEEELLTIQVSGPPPQLLPRGWFVQSAYVNSCTKMDSAGDLSGLPQDQAEIRSQTVQQPRPVSIGQNILLYEVLEQRRQAVTTSLAEVLLASCPDSKLVSVSITHSRRPLVFHWKPNATRSLSNDVRDEHKRKEPTHSCP